MTNKKDSKYVPDWRVDSIDEGNKAANKAERDYSNRDESRKGKSGGSQHSMYHYEDKD